MRGLIVEWPMVSLVALNEAVGLNDTSARARIAKIYGFMEFSLPAASTGVSSIIVPLVYHDIALSFAARCRRRQFFTLAVLRHVKDMRSRAWISKQSFDQSARSHTP